MNAALTLIFECFFTLTVVGVGFDSAASRDPVSVEGCDGSDFLLVL